MAKVLRERQRTPTATSRKRSLPSTVNVPPANLEDYCWMIYGEKGVGKTTLASQFPNSIVFMFEPKRKNLRIKQVSLVGELQEQWVEFKEYIPLVIKQAKRGNITAVIDTVDRAYDAAMAYICFEKGIDHPSELNDHGRTWDQVKREFQDTMEQLLYSDAGLVFISHAHTVDVEDRTSKIEGEERKYKSVTPTCKPACWTMLKAMTDFATYYGYRGPHRTLTIRGSQSVWASCGVDASESRFMYKGEPLATFLAGNTPQESFKILKAAYENKVPGWIVAEDNVDEDDLPPAAKPEKKAGAKKKFFK